MTRFETSNPDPFGRVLRSFRKRNGLNQTQFARKVLVTQNTISRYEQGLMKPSPRALYVLLHLVGDDEARGPILRKLRAQGVLESDLVFQAATLAGEQPQAAGSGPEGDK